MREIVVSPNGETTWIACPGCSGEIGVPPDWPAEVVCCPKCAAVVSIDERTRVLWRPSNQPAVDFSGDQATSLVRWLPCHACGGEIGVPPSWYGPTIACPKCGAIAAIEESSRALWRPPVVDPSTVIDVRSSPVLSGCVGSPRKSNAVMILANLVLLAAVVAVLPVAVAIISNEAGAYRSPEASRETLSPAVQPTPSTEPQQEPLPQVVDVPPESPPQRFWTWASSKRVVEEIEGPAQAIHKYPGLGYEEWTYRSFDTIKFDSRTGQVCAWNNASGRLFVALGIRGKIAVAEPDAAFCEDSLIGEVVRAQGTPKSIETYAGLGYMEWGYNLFDKVRIDLRTARVTEWDNHSGSLHLRPNGTPLRRGWR